MLVIEKMRLNLPAGFEGRVEHISRLVARELGGMSFNEARHITGLSVPPIHIHQTFTDERVARRVALAIHNQIEKPER
ncbi:MAG TPA: hypothetical protein ENK96_01345 [Desulfobulbaceae bacterium]|nr:hypothetical protein [Desulfobulbaceae bacterium]